MPIFSIYLYCLGSILSGNHPACSIESFHTMFLYGRRVFQELVRAASHNFNTHSVQGNEWNDKLSVLGIAFLGIRC
jgi:hypothetical protein